MTNDPSISVRTTVAFRLETSGKTCKERRLIRQETERSLGQLSQDRAKVLNSFLVTQGIAPKRLEALGFVMIADFAQVSREEVESDSSVEFLVKPGRFRLALLRWTSG
jgi:hypothetical protein